MRYQTEMTRAIVTNKTAQQLMGWVSPIYGNSYVGLWLFQAIGSLMGGIGDICEALKLETNPATATLLLDQWEDQYAIPRDDSLTVEQRRARLVAKRKSSGPCNPAAMEAAVSAALGGAPVEVTENVAKNTFLLTIKEYVPDIAPAVAVLERMKPAHLIYQIRMDLQMETKIGTTTAVAMTHAESHAYEIVCRFFETIAPDPISTAAAVTHAEEYTMEV